ncbi:protein of unknown function [Rhodovastum atsumiense]|nr:protein of unknown function [Rhodovastum atsumiense]
MQDFTDHALLRWHQRPLTPHEPGIDGCRVHATRAPGSNTFNVIFMHNPIINYIKK